MKQIIIAIFAIILVFAVGCDNETIVENQPLEVLEMEAIVKGNSISLLEAVEQFALDNYGEYPENVDSDTTAAGMSLIDYLPDGEKLINPFTGEKDQPVNTIPSSPGEIGYYKYCPAYNVYYIQGYGANSLIIGHDNIDEIETLIIEDCLALQGAVEAWCNDYSENEYPCSDLDVNDIGNTVIDYLPDGQYMRNRFTGAPAEPNSWGSPPSATGTIGYECMQEYNTPVGYAIYAIGFEPNIFIFEMEIN
jgi:hypothetical protein